MRFSGFALLIVALAGCADGPKPPPPPEQSPLTAAAWKELPADQKYTVDAFERLKAGDPQLYDTARWDAFHKAVVLPARRKDYPNGPKK